MAADIFGRTSPTLAGVFAPDTLTVLPGNGISPLLMQSAQIGYSQNVSKFFDLTGTNVYYVGGRTNGNMSVGRIVGPNTTITQLYSAYGNVCNASQNSLQFSLKSSTCFSTGNNNTNLTYTAAYCVLLQVGMDVQAQDMIIRENAAMMFASLTVTQDGVNA